MKKQMKKVKSRGASMVEYALLLVAVLILAAAAFKTLGKSVLKGAEDSNTAFSK